jgi:hypothetical protein
MMSEKMLKRTTVEVPKPINIDLQSKGTDFQHDSYTKRTNLRTRDKKRLNSMNSDLDLDSDFDNQKSKPISRESPPKSKSS